jgi:hypothetical protein
MADVPAVRIPAVNVPVTPTYLSYLGSIFTQLRDRFANLESQRTWIASNGGLAFLTAEQPDGLGLNRATAEELIAVLDQHHDVNIGYNGGPPAPQLDYKTNASPFWGGV